MNLWELLDLSQNSPVALVGAGGKSSVMARLAMEYREGIGEPGGPGIILTSTTRLKEEQVDMADRTVYLYDGEDVARCRPGEDEVLLVVKAPLPRVGKLEGVSPELVCRLAAAWPEVPIIVEADGAAGALFKVPGTAEPVIPRCVATVVAVSAYPALDCLPEPRRIHRWDSLLELFGPTGPPKRLGPVEVAFMLGHPDGVFKGSPEGAHRFWLINQVDAATERERTDSFLETMVLSGQHETILSGSAAGREPFVRWRGGR
jgi:probable selenium-dependent hydroxylase accessory protein YqeC